MSAEVEISDEAYRAAYKKRVAEHITAKVTRKEAAAAAHKAAGTPETMEDAVQRHLLAAERIRDSRIAAGKGKSG